MWFLVIGGLVVCAQQPPTFRTDVSEVHVDAEVLSAEGRVVTGLTAPDFRIFDEGQIVPIVASRTDEEALDLILLIDTSGSMRWAPQKLTAASHLALAELKHGDRVAVMTFNTGPGLVLPFTENLEAVENEIEEITRHRFGGNTYIHRAIDEAAQLFQGRRVGRRRGIVIVTDNVGTRTISEERVVKDLWEADAVLTGLIFSQPGFQARRAIVAVMAPYVLIKMRGMEHIAQKTGGDTIHADKNDDAFTQVMHRFRSRYSLYYTTPEGQIGSYRSIRVELTPEAQRLHPGARVHARLGYKLER
jgi:VWFA-related protein